MHGRNVIAFFVWAWPSGFAGLNGDGKNVQTLWWAELDRLHSMTRAHPPLGFDFVLKWWRENGGHSWSFH